MCGDGLPAAGQQCSARAIKHGRAGCRAGCRSQVAGCSLAGQGRAGQGRVLGGQTQWAATMRGRMMMMMLMSYLPPTSHLYVPDLAP